MAPGGLTSWTSSTYLLSLPKMWRRDLVSTCSSSEKGLLPTHLSPEGSLALTWCSVTTHGTTPAMTLGTPVWSPLWRAYHEKRLQGVSLLPTSGVKRSGHQHM